MFDQSLMWFARQHCVPLNKNHRLLLHNNELGNEHGFGYTYKFVKIGMTSFWSITK